MKLLLFLGLVALGQAQQCRPFEFECDNGTCIPDFYVCDGEEYCLDGSDEADCTCDGFECDGLCYPYYYECDDYADCEDGSDEQNCPRECREEEFQCKSDGRCLPGFFQCDSMEDCADGSDEFDCPCEGFICPGTDRCIPSYRVCNGFDDCGDGSDETEEACPCQEDEARCQQLPGSPVPGNCMPKEWFCDDEGIWDCPDGSDEANCTIIGDKRITDEWITKTKPKKMKLTRLRMAARKQANSFMLRH